MSLNVSVPLLSFSLDDLPADKSGVLKSPTATVLGLVYGFMFVKSKGIPLYMFFSSFFVEGEGEDS